MKTKNGFTYNRLNKYRRAFQLFVLLFLIAVPLLILLDVREIVGNLYSIRIFGLDIADPAMVLQTIVLSKEFYISLIIMALIPLILATIFGRVFCSWMCPYNSLLEFFENKKVKKLMRKIGLGGKRNLYNTNPKPIYFYAFTIIFYATTLIVSFPIIGFLSFPGIISSQIAAAILGLSIGLELSLFAVVFMIEILTWKRFWCKYVCPVGVVLSLVKNKKTLRVIHDPEKCNCKGTTEPCSISCPMDLDPKEKNLYPFCFNCGKCIKACEQTGNGALFLSFGNKKVK